MKRLLKAQYIIAAVAPCFILLVIILNKNSFFGNVRTTPESDRTTNDIHFNNNQNIIDAAQKRGNHVGMIFNTTPLSKQNNEFDGRNDIHKAYINNPKNIKLKELVEKAVKNVEGLPQYVWEPVRFTESDINENIASLEKIVLYSNKVKSNNNSIEDRKMLSELISEQLKDKIQYFKTLCTDVHQMSVARDDKDQQIIESSFRNCNEKIKELENKLLDYENEY